MLSLFGHDASAQATRTWVSGVGDDANPCSRTAPCKTFAGAISKTAPAGEIDVLDPGGFGALTITKAITIDGHASFGGVLVSGTNGIVVSAGANDVVTLRGLTFTGLGTGLSGVLVNSGGAVHVEDCVIAGFTTAGINAQAAATSIFVKHSTINNNGAGILIGGTASPTAVIVKSTIFNDVIGLKAAGGSRVSVHESVFGGHTMYGLWSADTAEINMDHGLVSGNGVGVQGDSTVRLSEVLVGHNTTGLVGNVSSFGNNRVKAGNTTDGAPMTTLPQQ